MSKVKAAFYFLAALNIGLDHARAEFSDFRAMWMSRFEYSTSNPADVQQKVANAVNMGITDLIFQVRGKADAYYNSNFEPRAERLSGTWDPLQTAVDAAHANGIKIHAWLNSAPIWRGTAAPVDANHIFHNTNPSFRRFDSSGVVENPLNQNGEYASSNLILPEVHTHINNVVNDIATNYDVDGIHLDYIRWLGSHTFSLLPHDAESHQLFNQATGLDASLPGNAGAYRNYYMDRVTDLVGSVKTTVDAAEVTTGRTVDLSAAVRRNPTAGVNEWLQDYSTWMQNGDLDIVMPMIYLSSSNNHLFAPDLTSVLAIPGNTRVAPGIGAFLHTSTGGGVQLTVDQLALSEQLGADGATFFSYGDFFGGSLETQRRQAVIDFYDALVPSEPGPGNVIDGFEIDEGHFHWPYNQSPGSQTFGLGPQTTIERVTTEAQTGVGSQELSFVDNAAGPWQIRHDSGLAIAADPSANVVLPATGFIGLWLKTDDPGVLVEIALDDPTSADRGDAQAVIADNEWHLYQWNLEDDNDWNAWATSNGIIDGPTLTIDSIFFSGDGDATVYLDNVSHNPNGPLTAAPAPADFDGDGDVDGDDLAMLEGALGLNANGDTDGDGDSDGRDFLAWQQAYTGAIAVAASSTAVPEPSASSLAAFGLAMFVARRRRSLTV